MNGGTLAGLCKEDKAKIGRLYLQLLQEREEKEDILDNYNYEKEKFEQIIDLLQNQKHSEEDIRGFEQKLDKNVRRSKLDDESSQYERIPFPISPNSNSKELFPKSPDHHANQFHSPKNNPNAKKTEFASPVEYFGKVVNDIKQMKGELSKMQNNIKSLIFSPERSARNPGSVMNTDLKQTKPELTINDLTTEPHAARKKNKKKRKSTSRSKSRSSSREYQKKN